MLFYQELYHKASEEGHLLYNYPMRALGEVETLKQLEKSLIQNGISVHHAHRDIIIKQIGDNYPDCSPSDECVRLFFQMDYSAPAFFFNKESRMVALLFPCGKTAEKYYMHTLPVDDVQQHLLCAYTESIKLCQSIQHGERRGNDIPLDLAKDAVWINAQNYDILADVTGAPLLATLKHNPALGMHETMHGIVHPETKQKLVRGLRYRFHEKSMPQMMLDNRSSVTEIAYDFMREMDRSPYILS